MKHTTQISLWACLMILLDVSSGLSPEEIKASLRLARESCNESKVDPATLAAIKSSTIIKDRSVLNEEATCLLDCLLRRTGMFTNDRPNQDKFIEVIQQLAEKDDDMLVAIEGVKKCIANLPSKLRKKCYAGEVLKICEHDYANDLSLLNLLLRP